VSSPSTGPVPPDRLGRPGGFVRACGLGELGEDGLVRAELPAGPAVVVVRTGGHVYALADRCSHQDFRLSAGEVFDGGLECALHGSLFDLSTGAPDGPPATRAVPVHAVQLDGDEVLVQVTPAPGAIDGAVVPTSS